MLLAGVAVTAAWELGPLAEPARVVETARALRASPLAPLAVPVAYVVLGFLMCPVSALRAATVLAFGPVLGPLYALLGTLASGLLGFAVGRLAGAKLLGRLDGRAAKLQAQVSGGGVLTIAALRLVPMGPFTLVNAAFGAAGARLSAFTLGTVLAMAPGMVFLLAASAPLELLLARLG